MLSLFGCQLVAGDFEIEDVEQGSETFCKSGEHRCNGEYLLTCTPDLSDWMLEDVCATAELCDSKLEQCRACNLGEYRCDGASRQECNEDGTAWVEVERCESDAMCNPTFCGNCTAGEFACRGEGENVDRQLWECGPDNTWSKELDTCQTPGVCSISLDIGRGDPNWSKMCVDPMCPEAGKYECLGQELRRCRQDLTGWDVLDTCASVALCDQAVVNATNSHGIVDMCPLGCLSAGMFVCEEQVLTRCRDDLTGYDVVMTCEAGTDCNPVEGSCSGPCQEGDHQCNGSQLRRCRSDSTWEEVTVCASPVLCITGFDGMRATSGECIPPGCPMAGEFMCEGAALFECRQDLSTWDTVSTCYSSDLCSALDKRCNEPVCQPDEYRCFDNELRHCNAGLTGWDMVDTCEAGEFCSNDPADPGCKLECPSETRCNGAELERCTPNGWVHQATCSTNDLCSCTLNDSCALGLATDGCGAAVCGGALAGYQCDGATLQRCQPGRNGWDDAAECGSAALCYPGAGPMFQMGYCATCPTAGEVRCATTTTGTRLETCSADRKTWNVSQSCSTMYGCVNSGSMDYCAICNMGQVQCSGATLQRCGSERRSWVETACLSAALCDAANNQCDVCSPPNSNRCDRMVLHHCSSDGQQDQTQTCANLCDPTAGECDACVANTSRCSNTTLYKCSPNGQTETPTTCATSALCNAAAQVCDTPICAVNDKQCNGRQPEICNTGRNGWVSNGTACVSVPLCSGGNCILPTCEANQRQCSATGRPQICNDNRNGWTDAPACAASEICQGGLCVPAACDANAVRCMGNQPQACNSARTAWVNNGTACTGSQICMSGACVAAACDADAVRCVGDQPQICNPPRTAWVNNGNACTGSQICMNGACVAAACDADEVRCMGNQPQICNSARTAWMDNGNACTGSQICVSGACTAAACDADEVRCMGNQPQICNSARTAWVPNGDACAGNQICMNGACVTAACAVNEYRCMGALLQVCNENRTGWDDVATCQNAALCMMGLSTGMCMGAACAAGEWNCAGVNLERCRSDLTGFDFVQMCASPQLCDEPNGECDDCMPPVAPQCLEPEILRECTAQGHWMDTDCAATGNVCDEQSMSCAPPPPPP